MALTEDTVIDQITVTEAGTVLVRRAQRILKDGEPLPDLKRYHRTSFEPGADLSAEATIVQKIAALVWTPEVIAAATDRREAVRAALTPPPEGASV